MAGNPTGIAAFVEAFGNSFAHVNNQRIQQQLALKHSQDSAIAETLIKSGMEDPTLWDNENFAGPAKKVLGAQNAKAIAEIAKQYAASPMGVLRRGFGAEALTRPDVPPEGPVFNPQALDARPEAINAVVAPRISGQTPIETGLGFDSQTGFLQAKTQDLATKPPLDAEGLTPFQRATIDLKKSKDAATQANADRTFAQHQADVDRRAREQRLKLIQGQPPEVRQTPVGERMVRRWTDPETGIIYVAPIGGIKQAPSPGEVVKTMRNVNQGLRYADTAERIARAHPEEIASIFQPVVGKRLVDLQNQLGAFSPAQKKFVLNLLDLRNSRINTQGGQALTPTENQLYNEVLPSNFNTTVQLAMEALTHANNALTSYGAVTESIAEQNRQSPVKTQILSPQQRDFYKKARVASKHSFRDRKQIPLLPGEVLFDGDTSRFVLPGASSGGAAPSPTTSEDEAAVNAAFLGQ